MWAAKELGFLETQEENLVIPLPEGTTNSVIAPTLEVVGSFEVHRGLMAIDIDYGWMRAQETLAAPDDGMRPIVATATDTITLQRTRLAPGAGRGRRPDVGHPTRRVAGDQGRGPQRRAGTHRGPGSRLDVLGGGPTTRPTVRPSPTRSPRTRSDRAHPSCSEGLRRSVTVERVGLCRAPVAGEELLGRVRRGVGPVGHGQTEVPQRGPTSPTRCTSSWSAGTVSITWRWWAS